MKKTNRITNHLLSLGGLCIGFVLCRYILFGLHGMKQWPAILFGVGAVAVAVSFSGGGTYFPRLTALGYPVSFLIGLIFQCDGTDAGGARTNNLWIIWTVAFAALMVFAAVVEGLHRGSEEN